MKIGWFGLQYQGNSDPSHIGIRMDNMDHKTSLQESVVEEHTISGTNKNSMFLEIQLANPTRQNICTYKVCNVKIHLDNLCNMIFRY